VKVPLYKVYCDEEDVKALTEVARRGTYWAIGPEIKEFEKKAAMLIGTKYCVAFNSGTSALHAMLLACKIGKGAEVIVPSFTFIATANAPLFVGARPIFADIENITYGLDPEDVKRKITKKTKAIMPIHYGGLPCRINELKEIAKDYDLLLLEDAAESLGASINGKNVGTFGDAAMFSFCGNKVITTGEGGIIVTNSDEICNRLRLVRSHGRVESENYFESVKTQDYVILGYNWRMSTFTAALGISQLNKLKKVIELRREKANYLMKKLCGVGQIEPLSSPQGYFNVYQMFTVRVKEGRSVRDALKDYLNENGVSSKIYFEPVHHTYFYRKLFNNSIKLPVTEKLSDEVLTLPIFADMSLQQMDYIIEKITEFFRQFS